MKFTRSFQLKRWMDAQRNAGASKELLLRATFVLQQWRNIESLKRRKKTVSALEMKFFKADCELLALMMAGENVVPFKRRGK